MKMNKKITTTPKTTNLVIIFFFSSSISAIICLQSIGLLYVAPFSLKIAYLPQSLDYTEELCPRSEALRRS